MNAKKEQVLGPGFIALVQMKQQIKKLSNYSFPGKSVKLAQQYSTKLVWALEDTPANN